MDSIFRNAFRLLNLPPGTPMPAVRAAVAELRRSRTLPEKDIADALRRIESPETRLQETVFGGGPVPGGRPEATFRLEALLNHGGPADAWVAANREWQDIARDEGFRAAVKAWAAQQGGTALPTIVPRQIGDLPEAVLLATVMAGQGAMARGEREKAQAIARAIAIVTQETPAKQKRALAVMTEAGRAPAMNALGELGKSLELLERVGGKDAAPRVEGLVMQAGSVALPAAASLEALGPGAADEIRDGYAQILRCAALLNLRAGGPAERTVKWQDEAAAEARSESVKAVVEQDRQEPAIGMGLRDVVALAKTGKVEKARRLVSRLKASAKTAEGRKRLQAWLDDPRFLLGPIGASPPLFRLNGFGCGIYGSSSRDTEGTYVTTLCVSALWLPVFPIRSYLVRSEGQGYRFFGRVPLPGFARIAQRVGLVAVALLAIWIGREATRDEAAENDEEALQVAQKQESQGQHLAALQTLTPVAQRGNSERIQKAGAIARSAVNGDLARLKNPFDVAEFLDGGVGRAAWGIPRSGSSGWYDDSFDAAVARCLETVAWPSLPDPAASAKDAAEFQRLGELPKRLLAWAGELRRASAAKFAAMGATFGEAHPYPPTMAAALDGLRAAGMKPPAPLAEKLATLLQGHRWPGWGADAMSCLRSAEPAAARPVLYLRARDAWLGRESGEPLRELTFLPAPLAALLQADAEKNGEKRLALLEKAKALVAEAPADAWHPAGVARRFATTYRDLNDLDPAKYPISLAIPPAIASADAFPDDGAIATLAMQGLLATGDAAKAASIGERAKDAPGTRIWLGVCYARLDREKDAEAVLEPIVKAHFDAFVTDWLAWAREYEGLTKGLWQQLDRGSDQALVQRLNALPPEKAQVEAEHWVRSNVEINPRIRDLDTKARSHGDVRDAARELAMIWLRVGRSMGPGEERKALLAKAEKLFLGIRKVSDDRDADDLRLVEVYLWLGRNEDADALISKLEASPDGMLLTELGDTLREVGRNEAARRLLEKAYAACPSETKAHAASLRSLVATDEDDSLAWLGKCKQDDPYIMAVTAETQARKLMGTDRQHEAEPLLRKAAEYWERRSDNAVSLNNAGLNYQMAFLVTGDSTNLANALRALRKSLALNPENPLVATNTVSVLSAFAWDAIGGKALRVRIVGGLPTAEWTDYLDPPLPFAEYKALVRARSELREAADLGERAALLAPDQEEGFAAQLAFIAATDDTARLKRLLASLEASPPARPEEAARNARYAGHNFSQAEIDSFAGALPIFDKAVERARKEGHAPTLAWCLVRLAGGRLAAVEVGASGPTVAQVQDAAEEALRVFDCESTRSALANVLVFKLVRSLSKDDQALSNLKQECGNHLVALWARGHGDAEFTARVAKHPDYARILELTGRTLKDPASSPGTNEAMKLAVGGDPRAADVVRTCRERGIAVDYERVLVYLSPGSASTLAHAWCVATLLGDAAAAGKVAAEADKRGVLKNLLHR